MEGLHYCCCGIYALGATLYSAGCDRLAGRSGARDRSVAAVVRSKIGQSRRSSSRIDKRWLLLGTDPWRRVNESYNVIEHMGAGGFGSVFRAECRITKETVAIKHIKKLESEEEMQYLYRELESLLRLDHPNIAKFYRFFEDASALYLVTEFCSGGDFNELLGRGPRDAEARQLFRDVVIAAAYCHNHGIVHRDIKFENCLIQESSHQRRAGKVIDFGLAAIRQPGDMDVWLNDILGTRFFVAPEVMNVAVSYGTKCDCWSLGVMLYILVSDQHPFAQEACKLPSQALLDLVVNSEVRTQPLDDAGVEDTARDLIMALLKKDPEERMDAQSALFHCWLDPAADSHQSSGGTGDATRSNVADTSKCRTYSAPPVKLGDDLIARIRTFGAFTRFERSVLTLVAHYAQEQDIVDVQAAFFQLDSTRSGSLTRQEINEGLAMCGHEMSEEEFEELFRSLDGNGDGEVNYTEWLAATMQPQVLASSHAIEQLYNFFVEEGGGVVRTKVLQSVLGCDSSLSRILGPGSEEEDATLNETQFQSLMREIASGMGRETAA